MSLEAGKRIMPMGHRPSDDELLPERGLDRRLDFLDFARQRLDLVARRSVEQRDARTGTGRVSRLGDEGWVAVGHQTQNHGVGHIDMAAEGTGERDAGHALRAEAIHQQPHPGIKRALGKLDRRTSFWVTAILGGPARRK